MVKSEEGPLTVCSTICDSFSDLCGFLGQVVEGKVGKSYLHGARCGVGALLTSLDHKQNKSDRERDESKLKDPKGHIRSYFAFVINSSYATCNLQPHPPRHSTQTQP
jgi:hypothetical protein